jgi:hypothetical protein
MRPPFLWQTMTLDLKTVDYLGARPGIKVQTVVHATIVKLIRYKLRKELNFRI